MNPDSFAASVFARFVAVAALVAAKGFHDVSPWWGESISTFLASLKRQWVIRAGRRAGKSSTLCLLAVAWVLVYPTSAIPLGDVGVVAFVSVDRREVEGRLRTIESLLGALGIPFERRGDAIDLVGRPFRFQAFTASVSGVSGFTCILAICDEVAKWKDNDSGTNPAREVLSSIRPTLVTQPLARIILCSSPWSTFDAHAEAFVRGADEFQMVSHVETWIANPSLTEADTHGLEPDMSSWSREYAAIPMRSTESAFFDLGAIEMAVSPSRPLVMKRFNPGFGYTLFVGAGADFAFTGDSSAIAVCYRLGTTTDEGEYSLAEIDELQPSPGAPLRPSEVCARFALVLRRHGCRRLYSDSWQFESVSEFLEAEGIGVDPAPAGNTGKVEVYTRARTLLHQGIVTIPQHRKLIAQLQEVVSRPTATGLSITSPRKKSGHGDLVSAFVLALWNVGQSSSGYQVKLERLHEVMTGQTPGVERTNQRWADKARRDLLHTAAMTRTPEELAAWRAKNGLDVEDEEPAE